MGMDQTGKYCERCHKNVLATRPGTNHVLHLLLSIVTFGLWMVVWFMASVKFGGWRCTQCGWRV